MTINLSALQKQRRDSAANWTAENPTLLAGEIGIESDTGYWKVGDGSTAWTSLAYVSGLGAEIPVDRLADGTAGQIIQTDSAGTGVEWSDTANLPLGSASAPAYRFQGDANTGIYSPGADQVAISTNGTGRLFVDASGNVGVGTASPLSILDVKPSSNRHVLVTSSSSYANNGIIATNDGGSEIPLGIGGTPIQFFTQASERARIDSSGRVGIGTTSPDDTLHLVGSTGYGLKNTDGTHTVVLRTVSGGGILKTASNHALVFGTNDTERARIDSSGRVGIGTTNPTEKLQVSANALINSDGTGGGGVFVGTPGYAGAFTYKSSGDAELSPRSGYALTFASAPGGTERARIDSSGRLLIGTSSDTGPDSFGAKIQIAGTSTDAAISIRRDTNGTGNPALIFGKSRSATVNGNTIVQQDDRLGVIAFYGADGTDLNSRAAAIYADVDGTPGANDMPGRLVFATTADGSSSPTERMRLDNRGQLMLQSTTSTFDVGTTQAAGTSYSVIFARHSGTVANPGTGTVSFRVYSNGDVQNTNNSYGSLSDIKLKENIVNASSQWNDLKALQVRNYNFKPETNQQTHTQIGLIAQEVELVSPGLVSESPDRDEDGNDLGTVTKSVNYSVLYMKAVKALQEAMERIEVLEAKVNALEGN